MAETRKSLTRTAQSFIEDLGESDKAIDKALSSLGVVNEALLVTQVKLSVGAATLNELAQVQKAVLTAEKDIRQARFNHYFGTQKIDLLVEGILVN